MFWLQAYTSQFLALTMFALMMSEDRISMQQRRKEIVEGMRQLPGEFIIWNGNGLSVVWETVMHYFRKRRFYSYFPISCFTGALTAHELLSNALVDFYSGYQSHGTLNAKASRQNLSSGGHQWSLPLCWLYAKFTDNWKKTYRGPLIKVIIMILLSVCMASKLTKINTIFLEIYNWRQAG